MIKQKPVSKKKLIDDELLQTGPEDGKLFVTSVQNRGCSGHSGQKHARSKGSRRCMCRVDKILEKARPKSWTTSVPYL